MTRVLRSSGTPRAAPSPVVGEGWGGGSGFGFCDLASPPSRRFAPTSPTRGEMTERAPLVANKIRVAR
jgi:hypothetical protein